MTTLQPVQSATDSALSHVEPMASGRHRFYLHTNTGRTKKRSFYSSEWDLSKSPLPMGLRRLVLALKALEGVEGVSLTTGKESPEFVAIKAPGLTKDSPLYQQICALIGQLPYVPPSEAAADA